MTGRDNENNDSDLSPEDQDLWAESMRDVKPLPGRRPVKSQQKTKQSGKKKKQPASRETVLPDRKPQNPARPQGRELDGRTEERFRRGKMPIEARLDLHGMRQAEAREALERFILSAHANGKRCVLVITGRGMRGRDKEKDWWEERPGVLKRRLPGWLSSPALRDIVLKTYPARPRHGGAGAFYLYLRRRRNKS